MRPFKKIIFLVLAGMFFSMPVAAEKELPIQLIKLPPGFKIDIYASNVLNAREMTLGPDGIIFVGTHAAGNVYAVVDNDKDQKADEVVTIIQGLRSPNGVAYRDGALYVAEINRVLRFDNIARTFRKFPRRTVINSQFADEGHHGWKFIAFGPDGLLYVPVGMPCNVCEREDDLRFGSIMRMNPDGTNLKLFARGIRNTVGFDWHPETRELWFTDNGRDWLGDNFPPDELNRVPKGGLHFGFPYCNGDQIPDPEFGQKYACKNFVAPAMTLGPHVASLGMRFYTGSMFPQEYRNHIFIAEHGSWNSSKPVGYRLTNVFVDKNGKAVKYATFAEGWLYGGKVWGRPVDVLVMPDGALLVSDDFSNAIYRISYSPK